MLMRQWIRGCQHAVLIILPALLTVAASAAQAPNAPAESTPEQRREEFKRFFDAKEWHVQVRVTVNGGGQESDRMGDTKSYSVNRLAEYNFKVGTSPSELRSRTTVEQVVKQNPGNPILREQYERLTSKLTWNRSFEAQKNAAAGKAGPTDTVNFAVDDRSRYDSFYDVHELIYYVHSWSQTDLKGSTAEPRVVWANLSIDLKKRTYDIELPADTVEVLEAETGSIQKNKKSKREVRATGWDHLAAIKDRPLPDKGTLLQGRIDIRDYIKTQTRLASRDYGNTTAFVDWTASPKPLPDVDLWIKAENYDKWLPAGGKTEDDPGNTIKINARLKARGAGGLGDTKIKRLRFVLVNSSEPGVCMNAPQTNAAETPDLKFLPAANPGYRFTDAERWFAFKDGECTEGSIVVTAFDWGAWGVVRASAELTDGRVIGGKVEGTLMEEDLRLPKRHPGSLIADKWKEDHKVVDLGDNDDCERDPAGHGCLGDGFTLYEEYRGFIENNQHVRGDPKKRDLFIYNGAGGPAERGIQKFTELSELAVHDKVLNTEIQLSNRCMNLNHSKGPHRVDQHAVCVVPGDVRLPQIVPVENTKGGRPGRTTAILAPKSSLLLSGLLAQELFHAVGVGDHGEKTDARAFYLRQPGHRLNPSNKIIFTSDFESGERPVRILDERTGRDMAEVFGKNMKERLEQINQQTKQERDELVRDLGVTDEEARHYFEQTRTGDEFVSVSFTVGKRGDENSGDRQCIMGGIGTDIYEVAGRSDLYYYVHYMNDWPNPVHLCTSPDGKGPNAASRGAKNRHGDSRRGDCKHQICVNDGCAQ